jgi:succinate dehydrogenase / fumarate reductase flavoprotein subunit
VNWRVHSLAWVDGNKVTLGHRPVHLDPLTTAEDGGIDLKKIAPKARVY